MCVKGLFFLPQLRNLCLLETQPTSTRSADSQVHEHTGTGTDRNGHAGTGTVTHQLAQAPKAQVPKAPVTGTDEHRRPPKAPTDGHQRHPTSAKASESKYSDGHAFGHRLHDWLGDRLGDQLGDQLHVRLGGGHN